MERFRTLDQGAQQRLVKQWNDLNRQTKDYYNSILGGLGTLKEQLLMGAMRWGDAAPPFLLSDLPPVVYVPPKTRSTTSKEDSKKKKRQELNEKSEAIVDAFNADTASKKVLADATNTPAQVQVAEEEEDEDGANTASELCDENGIPVGLAHDQDLRDAAAQEKVEAAKSGNRRKLGEPCTKVTHQVDRLANRVVESAHLTTARAAEALDYPDAPKGAPRRKICTLEFCEIIDTRAHGGGTAESEDVRRTKTLVTVSGHTDQEDLHELFLAGARATKHRDPNKSSTHQVVRLGRVPGVHDRPVEAVVAYFAQRKARRSQPTKHHRSDDEILQEQNDQQQELETAGRPRLNTM
jgi:hypothetical protein